MKRYKGCVALARSYMQPRDVQMLLTCGVSASGKSTVANGLTQELQLVHITSDRERKGKQILI